MLLQLMGKVAEKDRRPTASLSLTSLSLPHLCQVAEKDILMAAKIFDGMDVDDTGVLREAVRG